MDGDISNAAIMVMMPIAQPNGVLTYFWVVKIGNEINVGWCEDGTEISRIYDKFKKKAGGYLILATEQIVETGEQRKMDMES